MEAKNHADYLLINYLSLVNVLPRFLIYLIIIIELVAKIYA